MTSIRFLFGRWASAAAAAVLLGLLPFSATLAAGVADTDWAATWQAAPEPSRAPAVTLSNQTVRQIVRVSLGGAYIRVRLTNEFGDKPVTIGAAHIAITDKAGGSAIQTGYDRP